MKLAFMMRAMDSGQGFEIYIKNLVDECIRLGTGHTFLLLYRTDKHYNRYAGNPRVTEKLLRRRQLFIWDQWDVPLAAWREKADIIINPKFSVPLFSSCPVAMGLQEPTWWSFPEHHPWWDVLYMRLLLPRYIRKSVYVFPMSQFILDENRKYVPVRLPPTAIAYAVQNPHFRPIDDPLRCREVCAKYGLPEKFILAVTRVLHTGIKTSAYCPTKNLDATVKAFLLIRDRTDLDLVVLGKKARDYLLHRGFSESDLIRIHFRDFVVSEELVFIHNACKVFIIPSWYEGCPGTLLEALASGDAIVASTAGSVREVAGDAALFADPDKPEAFADNIMSIVNNPELRAELKRKSLERTKRFSWQDTAQTVLNGLEQAVRQARGV